MTTTSMNDLLTQRVMPLLEDTYQLLHDHHHQAREEAQQQLAEALWLLEEENRRAPANAPD